MSASNTTSNKNSSDNTSSFNLSDWALSQKSLVTFMMLLTMIMGTISYTNLSRNEDPPFTIKTMVVAAYWPGASTEDTANLLTDKIEEKLEETPFLDRLDSYSRSGESVVFVNLRDNTPPEEVSKIWYQVRKKVNDAMPNLPSGIQGPFFDDEFGDTFGMIYGMVPEGFTLREARDQLDTIRADILKTPDIGKVILLGVQEEQIVVEFSMAQLATYGLQPEAVVQALQNQNSVTPAGNVRLTSEVVAIRVSGAFASEESLRTMTLRVNDRFVPLTDIAKIHRISVDPPSPMFRVNGQQALGIAISMAPTGNLLEFGEKVREKLAHAAEHLPHGMELIKVADQTTVVEEAVHGFVKVLVEAILIVLAVSFLSLGTRAGLVVTFSIPLVLAMTFVGMELAGIGLQRISLGALIIALGLLVDDAMITVEAMVSRLEIGWSLEKSATYAYESTAFPMLTGTLVMIAGFIPVGFAASSAGEYCFSLFMVVLISLVASWIVAVLFSPLIGTWILTTNVKGHHGEGLFTRTFRRLLDVCLTAPILCVLLAVAVFGVSIWGSSKLQQQFFPPSDRPELLVNVNLPQSATIESTLVEAQKVEALLQDDENIDRYSTYVGSGAIRFYLPMDVLLNNENIFQMVIVTKGLAERDVVRSKLEKAFEQDFADFTSRVMPLELGPPVGWPLKYRVTGPDISKVREAALQLANIVAESPNTRDVNLTAGEPQKRVGVTVNQAEARALGLSSQDVASVLATNFSGTPVTTVRDGRRNVNVVMRGVAAERFDIDAVSNLQIATPLSQSIPLRQIASVNYGVQEPIIWKRKREPLITVQADIQQGLQPASVSQELSAKVAEFREKLPTGYRVEEGGAVEESEKGNQSIMAVIPYMLMVMVTLLMIQLRSFTRVALALLMAPFGLIGVVAAMLPTGTPMGFVAQLGVFALAGMIIRNAVILIEEVDIGHAAGKSIREAITEAAVHRARPIMLTALAAILGMIPIAGQVFWGPMAYAIIGGLTIATVLTLTVLPCLLLLLLNWEESPSKGTSSEPLAATDTVGKPGPMVNAAS